MKTITCGLIAGRHNMPVDKYIFDEIPDVLDFNHIRSGVAKFIAWNCDIGTRSGTGINQANDTNVIVNACDTRLVVYVTGLTAVTAEVIRCCSVGGVPLTLMHYDRDTGTYVPQVIF